MGMFDKIMFVCPDCGRDLEEQSKAGHCGLDTYYADYVPEPIARDIDGSKLYCEGCGKTWRIIAVPPDPKLALPMGLVEA